MPKTTELKIRDTRHKETFVMDDEFLNGYSAVCGIYATGVYMALCRHANREQEAWPSIESLAEKLGINRKTVMSGIKKLEEWGVITKETARNTSGKYDNAVYTLLDRSVWKPLPSPSEGHGKASTESVRGTRHQVRLVPQPSPSQSQNQVRVADHKVTQGEGNTWEGNTPLPPTGGIVAQPQGGIDQSYFDNPRQEIQIIGLYAQAKKCVFENIEQAQSFVRRNLLPARNLKGYRYERIHEVMNYLANNANFKWTLETVAKYIDEDLARNSKNSIPTIQIEKLIRVEEL